MFDSPSKNMLYDMVSADKIEILLTVSGNNDFVIAGRSSHEYWNYWLIHIVLVDFQPQTV